MSNHDQRTRMRRVPHFFTAKGEKVPNTDRALAPFRLMLNAGDYFEVSGRDCLVGNLCNLASMYSLGLGRRFSLRTLRGPNRSVIHRVTLMGASLGKQSKPKPKKRALFRVEHYFTPEGEQRLNTDVDTYGRPAMYPFELMRTGEFFIVEAGRSQLKAVMAAVSKHSSRTGCQFGVRQCPENPKKITVTRQNCPEPAVVAW